MIAPLEQARRDRRMAWLRAKPAGALSAAEFAELNQLERAWDSRCRSLPRRIERIRHDLHRLEREAERIGLSPC